MSTSLPEFLRGLVDDAAIFPPGNARLDEALREHRSRDDLGAELVDTFVVDDRRLAELDRAVTSESPGDGPGEPLRVSVVVTGGAGALGPAATWASAGRLEPVGFEIVLRDSASGELVHNARRIIAAVDAVLDEGVLPADDVVFYVEPPRLYGAPPTPDWFGALDELAARELRLKLRTGGEDADAFPSPHELAGCIEAALDREMPFKCTAGLHHAVRHHDDFLGADQHGFLNVLAATRAVLDGATVDDAALVLAQSESDALTAALDETAMTSARRWFRSFGSCSIDEPLEDLRALGLVDA